MTPQKPDWDAAAAVEDMAAATENLPEPVSSFASLTPGKPAEEIGENAALLNQVLMDGVEKERLVKIEKPLAFEVEAEARRHLEANKLADEPSAVEIAAAEALLARVRPKPRDADAPVSQSSEPINLAEPAPSRLKMLHTEDGVTIIGDGDRIDMVRNFVNPEKPVVAHDPGPMSEKVVDKILAEQMAGRKTLERHDQRSKLFPKPQQTAREIELEGKSTPVFTPGTHPRAHLLNTPVVPGKGNGY